MNLKRTLCALTAALYLSACTTIGPPPYEPADPPPMPAETAANEDPAVKAIKVIAAVALLAGLVALMRSIPIGMPAMH